MHDPLEGVSTSGHILTGANRDQVATQFEPVLDAAVRAMPAAVSLYLYGSVATGMAQPPDSDVDLLTVGLPPDEAFGVAEDLSARFMDLCRAVEIAPAQPNDFAAETDEAYGGRVFLRHYFIHLAGPDLYSSLPPFMADAAAARGFNGDVGLHATRWREELEGGRDPAELGRRLSRKSLLAVAGLVSVHDATWTTDRDTAAARWAQIEPALAADLSLLRAWSAGESAPKRASVVAALEGVVAEIVSSFETIVGLWGSEDSSNRPGVGI